MKASIRYAIASTALLVAMTGASSLAIAADSATQGKEIAFVPA